MGTAARIKKLRTEKLLVTQRQLAERVGVDPITVSRWERGESMPTDLNRVVLARLAGVHPNWFLEDEEEAA
jgi:transcriptional regulator with XRE-family HTH domain